jgi:hypothetical protein
MRYLAGCEKACGTGSRFTLIMALSETLNFRQDLPLPG